MKLNKFRAFIAINLPEDIRERLGECLNKWQDLPVRWTKKENLHITLAFLGEITNEELVKISQFLKDFCFESSPFLIGLRKIDYGLLQGGVPRLIWVEGEESEEIKALKAGLDKSLHDAIGFLPDKKGFISHVTLGRVRKWDWQKIEPEERPQIPEDLFLDFEASSIEIMESKLKREGPEYTILESIPFKKL